MSKKGMNHGIYVVEPGGCRQPFGRFGIKVTHIHFHHDRSKS